MKDAFTGRSDTLREGLAVLLTITRVHEATGAPPLELAVRVINGLRQEPRTELTQAFVDEVASSEAIVATLSDADVLEGWRAAGYRRAPAPQEAPDATTD